MGSHVPAAGIEDERVGEGAMMILVDVSVIVGEVIVHVVISVLEECWYIFSFFLFEI